MSGETALDTSVAIRFLNGDATITERVLALPEIVPPIIVVGELLFGAENSTRPLHNLPRYLEFISVCISWSTSNWLDEVDWETRRWGDWEKVLRFVF